MMQLGLFFWLSVCYNPNSNRNQSINSLEAKQIKTKLEYSTVNRNNTDVVKYSWHGMVDFYLGGNNCYVL